MDYEFSVVDIETTGTSEIYDGIYELAVIRVKNGEVIEEYSSFIRTTRSLPPHILHRRGLSQSHFKFAPSYAEVLTNFHRIIEGAPVFAHNKSFDERFLNYKSYAKIGKRVGVPFLCSMSLSRETVKGLKSYSLSNLVSYFSLVNSAPHEAVADTRVCCDVILKLLGEETIFNKGNKTYEEEQQPNFIEYEVQDPIVFKLKE